MEKTYMTIDPGLNGTGFAIWNRDWELIFNNIFIFKDVDIVSRGHNYRNSLVVICKKFNVNKIFIEYPSLFQTNKGIVTATSGALVKLSWLVGVLSSITIETELIPVQSWKGQLPKEVVKQRILHYLPNVKAKSHDWDAIGIGLYKKGIF